MKIADLVNTLEYELAQPPSKAGQRLIGEHLLANLYGVSRMKARRSLDVLVERGCLVRRHGSGTYLRKIPIVVELPENYIAASESIFSRDESASQNVRLQPESGQQQLTLGLWSDLHYTNYMTHAMLGGIKQRVGELGHRLEVHSAVHKLNMPLSSSELEKQLRHSTCDGYMIITRWAEQFLEAANRVWSTNSPPIVYIHAGSLITSLEPLIYTDTQQAAERAVLHLIEGGFKNIGLIGTEAVLSHARHEIGYQLAMDSAGLTPLASVQIESYQSSEFRNIKTINQWLDQHPEIDSVCVMSETLLPFLIEQFKSRGRHFGRDVGVVTISNNNSELPEGIQWSCMEFAPDMIGSMAVSSLVSTIVTAGHALYSFSHQAHWKPGQTHLRQQTSLKEFESKPLSKRAIPTGVTA